MAKSKSKASKSKTKIQTVEVTRESVLYLHRDQLDSAEEFLEDLALNMAEGSTGGDAVFAALDFVKQAQTTARMLA